MAFGGRGFIFICAADSPQEQRLTIAHETAHFLLDYLWPRRQVLQRLGEGVAEVLDGIRPATPDERAAAILSHVRLGPHLHVLPRAGRDEDSDAVVARAEGRADRFALELVAPQAAIGDVIDALLDRGAMTVDDMCTALATHFGLPAYAFRGAIQRIVRRQPPSFVEDLLTGLQKQRSKLDLS